ncbi:hypothetical protein MKW98_006105, partial [Papaver atlanticum]
NLHWKAFQTLIFQERDEGLRDSGKIVAFDFDCCLANTDVRRIAQKKPNWDLPIAE